MASMDGSINHNQLIVVWYQVPTKIATSPDKLPYYDGVMQKIQNRLGLFPNCQVDFINCPVTDTINLSGELLIFAGLEQDLYNAGFRPKEIPNQGMDAQERAAFREAILRGGKLDG